MRVIVGSASLVVAMGASVALAGPTVASGRSPAAAGAATKVHPRSTPTTKHASGKSPAHPGSTPATKPGHSKSTTPTTKPTTKPGGDPHPTCGATPLTGVHFLVNGTSVPRLGGNVQSGDQVGAVFSVSQGCELTVRLLSFYEATPTYGHPNTNQVLFQAAIAKVHAGADQTLGPIGIPSCNFQVDFSFINHGKLVPVSHDNGGTTACGTPHAVAACTNTGTATSVQIALSNGGPGSVTLTVRRASQPAFSYTVTLAAGQKAQATYPFGNVPTDTITVTDNQQPQFHGSFPVAFCAPPTVSETAACSAGAPTAVFTAVNPTPAGGAADTIVVSQQGANGKHTTVLTLVVPAGHRLSGSVRYQVGTSPTFVTTGPFGLARSFQAPKFTSCLTGPPTTTPHQPPTPPTTAPPTPPGSTPTTTPASPAPAGATTGKLAFTGQRTESLLEWAILLVAAGGVLLLMTKAPRRARRD